MTHKFKMDAVLANTSNECQTSLQIILLTCASSIISKSLEELNLKKKQNLPKIRPEDPTAFNLHFNSGAEGHH